MNLEEVSLKELVDYINRRYDEINEQMEKVVNELIKKRIEDQKNKVAQP